MPDGETTTTGLPTRHEHDLTRRPARIDTKLVANLPESFRYRVKRRLLGPVALADQLGAALAAHPRSGWGAE